MYANFHEADNIHSRTTTTKKYKTWRGLLRNALPKTGKFAVLVFLDSAMPWRLVIVTDGEVTEDHAVCV